MNFLHSIVVIIVIVILIASVVLIVSDTTRLSLGAKIHFCNWDNQDRTCSLTSVKCEEYFETVYHLPCYLVYGHRDFGTDDWTAHMWNVVMIDSVPYEFESTTLVFKDVSDTYTIQDMQEGFYVDGERYERSQELYNWKELI